MQHEFVLRSEISGVPPLHFLLGPDGKLAAASRSSQLKVLRCEGNGLLTVMWGDRVINGIVSRGGERGETITVQLEGKVYELRRRESAIDALEQNIAAASKASGAFEVKSPIPGLVKAVALKTGDEVAAGQTLIVLEAMKMENEITAPHAGKVASTEVAPGQAVAAGALLVKLQI